MADIASAVADNFDYRASRNATPAREATAPSTPLDTQVEAEASATTKDYSDPAFQKQQKRGVTNSIADAFNNEATAGLIRAITQDPIPNDPNFTVEEWSKKSKEAVAAGLNPSYLGKLATVGSAAEFDRSLANAKGQQEREKALAADGWTGTGAHLLAGMLDPATLAVGLGSGSVLKTGASLAKINASRNLNGAVEAIAWGGASVGVKDAFSYNEVHASEYLAAGAFGFAFGHAFGPTALKATASGKNVAVAIGEDAHKLAELGKKQLKQIDDEAEAIDARQPVHEPAKPDEPIVKPPEAPVVPVEEPRVKTVDRENTPNEVIRQLDEDIERIANPAPKLVEARTIDTTASDAVINQIKSAAGEGNPIGKFADDIGTQIKSIMAKADDDAGRVLENKGASLTEKLRLAEDAATYKAPHKQEVHPAMEKLGDFKNLPAHIERDILSLGGKSLERLRTMGFDVRAFLERGLDKKPLTGTAADNIGFGGASFSAAHNGKTTRLVGINARMSPRMIARVMEHEEIHALVQHNAFTPDQWKALVDASKTVNTLPKDGRPVENVWNSATSGSNSGSYEAYIRKGITGQRLQQLGDEEAVSIMIGNEAILKGLSPEAEKVIGLIKDGTLAKRVAEQNNLPGPQFSVPELPLPGAVNAAGVPLRDTVQPVEREWLNTVGLGKIEDKDVARTFKLLGMSFRLDGAGWLGGSNNHMTRILGDLLFNDSAGKAGHAVNGQAVELFKSRLHAKNMFAYSEASKEGLLEWAKAQGKSVGLLTEGNLNRQFQREVGLAARGITPADNIAPGVMTAANVYKKVMEDMAGYAKNALKDSGGTARPLPGAEALEPNANYFTRRYHIGELNKSIEANGWQNTVGVIKAGIKDAQGHLSDDELQVISEAYLTRVHQAGNGMEEDLGMVLASGKRDYLRSELLKMNVDEAMADRLIAKLVPENTGADVATNLRHKTLLNENATHTFTDKAGNEVTMKLHELLDHDADRLINSYSQRMSGRIALAQVHYRNPTTGETIINGITSDGDFETLLKHVQEQGLKHIGQPGYTPERLREEVQHLRWGYDRLLSRPLDNQGGNFNAALRLMRSAQYFKLVNVGFSQVAEAGTILSNMGFKAALQQMPAAAGILHGLNGGLLGTKQIKGMFREIQAIGIGVNGAHGMNMAHGLDTLSAAEARSLGYSNAYAKTSGAIESLNKGVSNISRMPAISDAQQQWAAAAFAQKLFNMGGRKSIKQSDMNRLASMGLSPEMSSRIMGQLRHPDITSKTDGLFGETLGLLNFHKWTDKEASAALQNAMFRSSRKAIQTGDIGMMSQWMSSPVAQTLFQFKSFSINGYANHTLYAINHADAQGAIGLASSAMIGGLLYAGQQALMAQGRPDKDAYLREKLKSGAIAAGAFQRVGASSLLPMAYDSIVPNATNTKPLFTSGSTGSKSIVTPPLMGSIDGLATGVNGLIAKATGGREMSKTEANAMASSIPFARWAPISFVLNGLTANLPQRAPKAEDLTK